MKAAKMFGNITAGGREGLNICEKGLNLRGEELGSRYAGRFQRRGGGYWKLQKRGGGKRIFR